MRRYIPQPIDTSRVVIPRELVPLIERLAENNHDNWANKRFGEGWEWGEVQNDEKRQHPDLVPYSCLSENKKDYDRATVVEALKAIMFFGFMIEPPDRTTSGHRAR
ncbi:MAG: RyR domain-containing protein [Hyphomicrobiaceae bacterium]